MTNTVEPITDEERQRVTDNVRQGGYGPKSIAHCILRYEARVYAVEAENAHLRGELEMYMKSISAIHSITRNALTKGKEDE